MKRAAPELEDVLEQAQINTPSVPLVANVTAGLIESGHKLKELLVKQIYSSVLWNDSIKFLISKGVKHFIEIGPGKVLSGLVKRIDRSVCTYNIQSYEDTTSFSAEVSV